jgi:hypothetical protein
MHDAAGSSGLFFPQDAQRLFKGLPAVDQYRKMHVDGQPQLATEGGFLGVEWCAAKRIQPDFPNGNGLTGNLG